MSVPGVPRARQGVAVGVGHHEDFTGKRALGDHRDEPVISKAHVVKPLTGRHFVKLTGAAPHCQKRGAA
jgi:hypothetical protein